MVETVIERGPTDRETLFEVVWDQPYRPPSSDNALYVAVHRLRRKLEGTGLQLEVTADGGYELLASGPIGIAGRARAASAAGPGLGITAPVSRPSLMLIGRTPDLSKVNALLRTARIVTITGLAGVGKTTLMDALLSGLHPPGGVVRADLATADTGSRVCAVLARAVGEGVESPASGLPPSGSPARQTDAIALARVLGQRGVCVLAIDNAEHVMPAVCELVQAVQTQAPQTICLVTSREPLHLPGEVVYPLQSLASDAACELFLRAAAKARPGYAPTDNERIAIGELVEALDRLPLAILLAAARMRVTSVEGIVRRLRDRFQLLASKRPVGRHNSLVDALENSLATLPESELRLLIHATVFVAPFDAEQAERVLEFDGDDWVIDGLQSLVSKSLLQTEMGLGTSVQFRMLHCVRELAETRFATDLDSDLVLSRHGLAIVEEAEALAAAIDGPGGREALAALADGVPELLTVVDRFVDRDIGVACRAALAAAQVMAIRGPHQSLVDQLRRLIAAEPPVIHQRRILMELAGQLRFAGNPELALQRAQQAMDLCTPEEQADDRADAAHAAYVLGMVKMDTPSRRGEAMDHFVLARELARSAGEEMLAVDALNRQGVLHHWAGRLPEAEVAFGEAAARFRDRGAELRLYSVLGNLGAVERLLGRDSAVQRLQEAHQGAADIGARRLTGQTGVNLGNAYFQRGDLTRAVDCYRRAEGALAAAGDRLSLPLCRANLAETLLLLGEPVQACDTLEQVVGAPLFGLEYIRPLFTSNLAFAAMLAGRDLRARRALDDTLALDAQHNPANEAQVYTRAAIIEMVLGDVEAAARHADHAVALTEAGQDVAGQTGALLAQAGAALMAGDVTACQVATSLCLKKATSATLPRERQSAAYLLLLTDLARGRLVRELGEPPAHHHRWFACLLDAAVRFGSGGS